MDIQRELTEKEVAIIKIAEQTQEGFGEELRRLILQYPKSYAEPINSMSMHETLKSNEQH